jgi:hypothetical protein
MSNFTRLFLSGLVLGLIISAIGISAKASTPDTDDIALTTRSCEKGVEMAALTLKTTPEQDARAAAMCPALVKKLTDDPEIPEFPPFEEQPTWGCGLGSAALFNEVGLQREVSPQASQRYLTALLACIFSIRGR